MRCRPRSPRTAWVVHPSCRSRIGRRSGHRWARQHGVRASAAITTPTPSDEEQPPTPGRPSARSTTGVRPATRLGATTTAAHTATSATAARVTPTTPPSARVAGGERQTGQQPLRRPSAPSPSRPPAARDDHGEHRRGAPQHQLQPGPRRRGAISSYAGSRPRDQAAATPSTGSDRREQQHQRRQSPEPEPASRSSSSASSVTATAMASHGTIAGVIHRDSRTDQRRPRGIGAVAANCGPRPDHTVSTSDATAGAGPTAAEQPVTARPARLQVGLHGPHVVGGEAGAAACVTVDDPHRRVSAASLMPAPSASRSGPGGHGS